MPNPIVHWEISGRDGKKLQQFYADLFAWHINANNPMNYGLVDTHAEGGINGGIETAEQPRVTFYVQVDDLQAFLNQAQALGGKTILPPTVIPNMVTYALFADPEGNIIGLVKE